MTGETAEGLELRETKDYASMRSLAQLSGLEDGAYDSFARAVGFYRGGELVACAGLKVDKGVFSLECVAVIEDMRGKGLGRRLVTALENEARSMGATKIWALARTPEFFQKIGFRKAAPDESPELSLKGCMSCPQYLHPCYPSVVTKDLF